ncbi:MAG TPA: magnesium/cobalt transporter CorA [Bacteroidales bacterium]|nr:magnesium/cobalt transporter CorA [Bacteroidales bacterium]
MTKSSSTISKKAGLPPGALIHIGDHKTEKVTVSIISYNAENLYETTCKTTEDCFPFKVKDNVNWINVDGLHNIETIVSIGNNFGLHPLLLEDVLNTHHRPKMEEFDDYIFLTLKMLSISDVDNSLGSEQVSFVLGKTWVISFQEKEGDIFDGFRGRLRESKGNIRQKGADYLLYRLIDTVVDNYFLVTEHINDATVKLEEKVLHTMDKESLQEIQHLKKLLINLRKAVSPLREAVSALEKESIELIHESTTRYLRDVYEHIIQVNDSIESLRDMLANLMDLYLSGVSNKMNQVMQVLTIIATIFIPLTFIAGVYGMNFDYIPELHWKYGYFGIWGVMLAVFIVMIFYFKRKKWL